MAGDQLEGREAALRHGEGDHAGTVAGDVVAPAGLKPPARVFLQRLKARKTGANAFHRMEGGGGFFQKLQQTLYLFMCHAKIISCFGCFRLSAYHSAGRDASAGLHFFGIKKFLDKTNAASGSEAAS